VNLRGGGEDWTDDDDEDADNSEQDGESTAGNNKESNSGDNSKREMVWKYKNTERVAETIFEDGSTSYAMVNDNTLNNKPVINSPRVCLGVTETRSTNDRMVGQTPTHSVNFIDNKHDYPRVAAGR
ncbi:hypothetical protein Tco_0447006, partial [Tanacetum coccineum]